MNCADEVVAALCRGVAEQLDAAVFLLVVNNRDDGEVRSSYACVTETDGEAIVMAVLEASQRILGAQVRSQEVRVDITEKGAK